MLAPANRAKLVVCTTQIPDKPSLFQVSIVDSEQKHCYVRLPYYLTVEDAVRQSGSIVCLYAPVALGATTYCIVRFDMQDICNHEKLVIDVWDLHTMPTEYEWDERAARWWPVINGVSVHPGRFYYDDQFMESVPITRP